MRLSSEDLRGEERASFDAHAYRHTSSPLTVELRKLDISSLAYLEVTKIARRGIYLKKSEKKVNT